MKEKLLETYNNAIESNDSKTELQAIAIALENGIDLKKEENLKTYEEENLISISETTVPYFEVRPYLQNNRLTAKQAEQLFCLSEECGEVIQAIGKILRHGYEDFSPYDEYQTTNRQNLERELGNVEYWIKQLVESEELIHENIIESMNKKHETVKQFVHHQGDKIA